MRDLDISEVAQRSGVPASTLRFYEEKRLIASIGRRGLRRLFDPMVMERLALIAVSGAKPHGVPDLPPHPAGRGDGHARRAQSTGPAAATALIRNGRRYSGCRLIAFASLVQRSISTAISFWNSSGVFTTASAPSVFNRSCISGDRMPPAISF
jgi:hypothetical protein